jgi:hypothetical protein
LWQNQRFLPIFDVAKKYNYLILKVFIYAPTSAKNAPSISTEKMLKDFCAITYTQPL